MVRSSRYMITDKVSAALDVSKVEVDRYRYSGIDIIKMKFRIEISMNDYADSLHEIMIREDRSEEILTRDEQIVLRKYVRKLNWLAENTRPDIAI